MAKELDGKELLDLAEITAAYAWAYDTLYYFIQKGILSAPVKFHGDRFGYWYKEELDRIKNRPRSETVRGYKGNPSVPRIFQDPQAAQDMLTRIKLAAEPDRRLMKKRNCFPSGVAGLIDKNHYWTSEVLWSRRYWFVLPLVSSDFVTVCSLTWACLRQNCW
jgi:hypothetical protein